MGNSTIFRVFDREIPAELVEPLIERLCRAIANASYSLYGEEILDLAMSEVAAEHDF